MFTYLDLRLQITRKFLITLQIIYSLGEHLALKGTLLMFREEIKLQNILKTPIQTDTPTHQHFLFEIETSKRFNKVDF